MDKERLIFDDIVALSGDSKLKDCHFANGILTLTIEMDELDTDLILSIQTKKIECKNIKELDPAEMNCHIELLLVNDELETENGYYIPNKSFAKFMQSNKKGLNLVYGMKASEEAYLFILRGSTRLLTCVLENKEKDIRWELS